jgi:tetratricopeptide (TPR) repeat protein
MLSQRFINSLMTNKQRFRSVAGLRMLFVASVILLASGCASTGSNQSTANTADGSGDLVEGQQPVVPAQTQTLYEQAIAVMATGDFVDAELRLKEFLLQYPNYPGAYVNLAIIHASNGDDLAAEAAVNAALALDPDHHAALNQQGMLHRRNGKFIEAEAAYLKAVTSKPDYALAHYNLGVLNELYLQRLDAALQHFELYFELVGDDKQVERWIADLTRRVAANQRTANVAE